MRSFKSMATIVALCFIMVMGLTLSSTAPAEEKVSTSAMETILLTSSNTVVFRGVVTEQKVSQVELELTKVSRKLKATDVIYLVLDTPGGDVDAGNKFVDFVKGLPQKVKTITLFAASMGFHIAQNLDERLILPSGTLMSHRVRVSGASGEVPGELLSRMHALLKLITHMDNIASSRMGLELNQYQNLIRDEYWTDGRSSVAEKAADRQVYIKCDSSLDGTSKEQVGSFLGIPVLATFAKCPAIAGMLSIELAMPAEEKHRQEANAYMATYKNNRNKFVQEYIVTNRFNGKK